MKTTNKPRFTECQKSEYEEQKILVAWLRFHEFVFQHAANEGKRSYRSASALHAMGMNKGFPDLVIFSGPRNTKLPNGLSGIAVEMKRSTGQSKFTCDQKDWISTLNGLGWRAFISFGANNAINAIGAICGMGGYGHTYGDS